MRLAAIVAAGLLAGPCLAQTAQSQTPAAQQGRPIFRLTTFNDLVRVCDTPATDPEYDGAESLCSGYISGVLDDHRMETAAGTAKTRLCMSHPISVTAATGREMLAWARENARNGEEPAALGVVRFFAATSPCP